MLTRYEGDKGADAYSVTTHPNGQPVTGGTETTAEPYKVDSSKPVDLTADSLSHDDENQIVTASGNVQLRQDGRILKADRVSYDLRTDTVTATGNVILREVNGDIHFADEVVLTNDMKNGFVEGLKSYLSGGGQFTAETAERREGETVMTNASYTPCDCETDSEGDPAWQLRAGEVTYHEDEHRVSYKNARFEVFGVPMAWTPYFSHPDGQIKRKSGFLTPEVGYDSQLGAVITSNYYWSISPSQDATVGVMVTSQEAPVALAEYRKRFAHAEFKARGSSTYSGRTDSVAGEDVAREDEWRGHLFADGLWDVNDKWRAGIGLELTSDDQYLRQYDFSGKDVLENEVYAERFSGRNYAVGRLLAFQDVRIREERVDQPNVLPEIIVSMLGEPDKTLGGRWSLDLSFLGLERDGSGQDMNRVVGELGWQARHVADIGLVSTLDLSVRGDAYYVRDRDIATAASGRSQDGQKTRFFPRLHAMTSYPVSKEFENAQAVIEPLVALTLSPNVNSEDTDIPNEDSQDVQLDASNIFEPNRFPGKDRIEDDSHVTYGLRTGLYGYGGSYADIFLGQSYRFDDQTNPFPRGSGLTDQQSDIVGQIAASYAKNFGMNYRFQVDSDSFSSQRHELDGYADISRLHLNTRYLFAKGLEGSDIDESREQIENNVSFDLTENWRLRGGALHDLGQDPGLRRATVGLDYFGCCLSFSTTAQRNLTTDASGDSGTDITFRIGLKGLGDFQSSNSGQFSASNVETVQ